MTDGAWRHEPDGRASIRQPQRDMAMVVRLYRDRGRDHPPFAGQIQADIV